MYRYKKPGAYVEWQDATAPAITPLRTDIAAFIGIARRGPVDTPVPVESYRQFEAHFGRFSGNGFLAYAVRGFFENGGRRCWVARVAAGTGRVATASFVEVPGLAALARWRIRASSPGVWGDGVSVSVTTTHPAQTSSLGGPTHPRHTSVVSVAGFGRGDLVRITQPGLATPLWRVVSQVDANLGRLYWVHPEPGQGLPYDQVVTGVHGDTPLQLDSVAYTLAVRDEGTVVASYRGLTLIPEHPSYGPAVLPSPSHTLAPESNRGVPVPPAPLVIEELATSSRQFVDPLTIRQGEALWLVGGADGLADLTVSDFIGEPAATADDDDDRARKRRGMRAFDQVDDVAIMAVPDIVVQPVPEPAYAPPEVPLDNPCLTCPAPGPAAMVHQPVKSTEQPPTFTDDEVYRVQSALVELCEERRDRFAVLDPPVTTVVDAARGFAALEAWRSRFDTRHAALYYPWLRVVDPLGERRTRLVPPCGHVVGQYAWYDLHVGVHRAPANRPVLWAQDVAGAVDDARHELLHEIGVNALRVEPGRGLRILGARTMSSDPSWRQINVRRLVIMVMKAVDVATQWAVFEPNNTDTRNRVAQALGEFFNALWQRGALVGATAAEAFAVRCDETNNPPAARAEGRLVAEAALAPSQPFEFVVLRMGRQGNALEIDERSVRS